MMPNGKNKKIGEVKSSSQPKPPIESSWTKNLTRLYNASKKLGVEGTVNTLLGDPQGKAREYADSVTPKGEDQSDYDRHASAGLFTKKAIEDKTGSSTLGIIGSNLSGLAHEIGSFNKGDGSFHDIMSGIQEAGEDAYNNFLGSTSKNIDEVYNKYDQGYDGYGYNVPLNNKKKYPKKKK